MDVCLTVLDLVWLVMLERKPCRQGCGTVITLEQSALSFWALHMTNIHMNPLVQSVGKRTTEVDKCCGADRCRIRPGIKTFHNMGQNTGQSSSLSAFVTWSYLGEQVGGVWHLLPTRSKRETPTPPNTWERHCMCSLCTHDISNTFLFFFLSFSYFLSLSDLLHEQGDSVDLLI